MACPGFLRKTTILRPWQLFHRVQQQQSPLTKTPVVAAVRSSSSGVVVQSPLILPIARHMSTSSPAAAKYLCVHVFVSTKPGTEEAFKAASLQNARQSAQEPGIARFDVLQDQSDPTQFVLVEVYKTPEAPAAHKETAHYLTWRETVADMMAEPRQARKFTNVFPTTTMGWDYPAVSDGALET